MSTGRRPRPEPHRRGGRHPAAQRTVVRLTDPAVDDLARLNRADPQVVRWALKKMLLLERNPEAGSPLLGTLIGWRKLTVGDRDWRIVWRVTHDDTSAVIVDVAEIWAAGARSDGEVYAEMAERIDTLPPSPHTTALTEILGRLGRAGQGLSATAERDTAETLPAWLSRSLVDKVGLSVETVGALSMEDAVDTWNRWISRTRQ